MPNDYAQVWPRNIMIDELYTARRLVFRKKKWQSESLPVEQVIIDQLTSCRDRSDARLNSFSCRDAMER